MHALLSVSVSMFPIDTSRRHLTKARVNGGRGQGRPIGHALGSSTTCAPLERLLGRGTSTKFVHMLYPFLVGLPIDLLLHWSSIISPTPINGFKYVIINVPQAFNVLYLFPMCFRGIVAANAFHLGDEMNQLCTGSLTVPYHTVDLRPTSLRRWMIQIFLTFTC